MSLRIVAAAEREALRGLYAGGWDPPQSVVDGVRAIVAEVRARGDVALAQYTARWDFAGASAETLRVPIPPLDEARALVPADRRSRPRARV